MPAAPVNLLDFDDSRLTAFFAGAGENPARARMRSRQVLRWLHQDLVDDFGAMSNLAKTARAQLHQIAAVGMPAVVRDTTAADGTRKWLLDVGNGNAVDAVFIPEDDRGTLCVSSQAGCALDCAFCSTGKQGFNRNLSAAEIIGQLRHANRALRADGFNAPWMEHGRHPVTNVVMMGMGEPLANLENVVTALNLMLDDNAYGLSRRRVTLSTSGLVPALDRLRDACPVALAVSLHAPNDALRDQLVPINRKYPLAELLAACNRYLERAPRDFVTFEYVMLDGVNDQPEHARQLIESGARGELQDQPDPLQSVSRKPVSAQSPRPDQRIPESADRRRVHRDHTQDARRRHRCRVRTVGRPGPRQDTAQAAAGGYSGCGHGMTRLAVTVALLAVFAILAGCAMPVAQNEQAYSRQPGQEAAVQARARIHTELSAGYYARGQYDVALEELNGAIKDDPGYAPAYGMLGLVYSELRDDAQAERHFQRAIELNPQDPEVRNNYGWFLCQRGREPQALGQFELAIRTRSTARPTWRWSMRAGARPRSATARARKPIFSRRWPCRRPIRRPTTF